MGGGIKVDFSSFKIPGGNLKLVSTYPRYAKRIVSKYPPVR